MAFSVRLLLSILVVVVITTAATLVIAQRQNRATYGALVDELFTLQSSAFLREQSFKHATAAAQAARLATSVRLFAALEEGDPDLYKIAADELRTADFAFFRLLDRDGAVLPPPASSRAGMPELTPPALSAVSAAAAAVMARSDVQLGFISVQLPGASTTVPFRVLTVSINSFGSHVGTLVIGQPMDLLQGSGEGGAAGAIRSALVIDGHLASDGIEGAVADALQQQLGAAQTQADAAVAAGGTTWLYRTFALNEGSAFPPAFLLSTLSMASFDADQRALTWRIAGTGLVASLLAGGLALFLSRLLAEPVARLVEATRAIQAGDLARRLPPSSTREMNTLAASFNDMAAGLELKERYHSVLQQVTDPQVAEGLISGQVKLGGELRDVTVMFCDIRGYTALTVGRNPEEIIELLNHHMGAMTRIVQSHRGVINQFAGDAIMALFGAPRSYGDDALRAVRCALDMLAERDRINVEVAEPIRVGIGLASGVMVAGCIGAENRNDYTVVGERVNLAARLCSTARAGEILVDDATRDRVGLAFASEPMSPLVLKGFADAMPAFRVARDVA